ncbi:MAG TPA: DUF6328 family protein [Pyrinomonadaceae bacterium]|jgi:hypothetical protein
MAKLKDRIQTALDEGRMLILGSQVLLGFQYRSIFEKGFEGLPVYAQYLKLVGLVLMLIAVALLIAPSTYHRIVEGGEDTEALHRYITRIMALALLPFAFGLGIDFFVAVEKQSGRNAGIAAGIGMTLVALSFWYGLEAVRKREREPRIREIQEMEDKDQGSEDEQPKVKDKIKHVLTEARVVLPGAQALLGFQFASMLVEGFDKLPESSKYVHLSSLGLIALSIILLMTPAAYHRMVEEGEETEHFHRFSSRILLVAMLPLALGICGDLYVVARKVTDSVTFAATAAAVMLLFFYGLWYGFTLYRRSQRRSAARPAVKYGQRVAE